MTLFRVIDTETTGFPPDASMVEFGYTDVTLSLSPDNPRPNISGPFSVLLKPKHPISFGAMAIHHITEADVANAQAPEHVLAKMHNDVDYFVAHNAKFDIQFYNGQGKPWICTLKVARARISGAPAYNNQVLRYYLGLPCDPVKSDPAHRAGPDTYVTAHLLCHLLGASPTQALIDEFVDISGKPSLLTHVQFGKHRGKAWADVPRDYLQWLLAQQGGEEDVKHTARYWLNNTSTNINNQR